MSRASSASGRNLTLTEELERLEQSITLTLQEIDHNFSKAHRIVTTSILPLVEQYGEHSKSVWEASKFWKQFFEASANVSLSGYEELAGGDDETTAAPETTLGDVTVDYTGRDDTTAEQSAYDEQRGRDVEDSLLDDAEMSGSTPRPPASKSLKPQLADFDSPYEKLRRKLKSNDENATKSDVFAGGGGDGVEDDDEDDTMELPAHATATRLPDVTMPQRSSSLLLEEPTLQGRQLFQEELAAARKNKDPLLHRVLDKNYRIQATPHKSAPGAAAPIHRGLSPDNKDRTRRALWADSSPMSSPEMAVPKLRSDLYMSPARGIGRRGAAGARGAPRTPGVSVQTPGTARKTRDVFADAKGKGKAARDPGEITWESDSDEDFGGMSPPKTIQFALPPSKLMQTPAREASKRIVEDILLTAGAAPEESSEYSPTMVKMNQDILDDTF
ncbi:hypothetical protein DL766_002614 [Monosporascus sp. MC13-8B]|uniref:DASH complex subunit ASK1 n=1 Tax=Monosporascus cannonballus TaxID=155416 RepID=A0ABY0H3Z1_9PEZI|nr:hypothetical protein DL763_007880 [Monosporascus cannonballus]RYO83438.1 hypothetical protein DL762_006125 [Monosporascus cannonballus]RYP35271.1 hypothetical protein DL766_002614 [Monosporascus sp. MC13-8B]